jgi:Zn-dependent protease with chaperone function
MNIRGISERLISPKDLSPSWFGLYVLTLVLQLFCVFARFAVAYVVLWVIAEITGWPIPVNLLTTVIGWGPLVLSVATLILPIGGWWWELTSGGRSPTADERSIFDGAIAELQAFDPGLRPPHRWFILDTDEVNAAAYADTIQITRGMLESPFLAGALAHELGHLNSSDGRVSAAIHRMTTPPRGPIPFPLRILTLFATGELGLWITRVPWAMYWRSREFAADEYAARLGQAASVASFLDINALENDIPVPFAALSAKKTHPWTAHRIERLQAHSTRTQGEH